MIERNQMWNRNFDLPYLHTLLLQILLTPPTYTYTAVSVLLTSMAWNQY